MVREPDATMQPTLQDNQLMSKQRVLSLKPQLRLEWRGQDGQNETKQPDHSASLGDSITSSTGIRFSVHTLSLGSRKRDLCRAAKSAVSYDSAEIFDRADQSIGIVVSLFVRAGFSIVSCLFDEYRKIGRPHCWSPKPVCRRGIM
jgi:hypothetical protein